MYVCKFVLCNFITLPGLPMKAKRPIIKPFAITNQQFYYKLFKQKKNKKLILSFQIFQKERVAVDSKLEMWTNNRNFCINLK